MRPYEKVAVVFGMISALVGVILAFQGITAPALAVLIGLSALMIGLSVQTLRSARRAARAAQLTRQGQKHLGSDVKDFTAQSGDYRDEVRSAIGGQEQELRDGVERIVDLLAKSVETLVEHMETLAESLEENELQHRRNRNHAVRLHNQASGEATRLRGLIERDSKQAWSQALQDQAETLQRLGEVEQTLGHDTRILASKILARQDGLHIALRSLEGTVESRDDLSGAVTERTKEL